MSSKKANLFKATTAFIISGAIVLAAGWLVLNRQYALDVYSVWSYEPSEQIEAIESRSGFTDKGTFTFYATKPSLENQEGFNKECPRQEAGSPILGCYTGEDRIFIYDITDSKLDGMEEVTAVHEMLHAVWTRMSADDKTKIEAELREAYEKHGDDELRERMDYYQRTEPGEFTNELHSILGTEVGSLGEPLESYYAQYFDRGIVLGLHQQYNSVYKALYARADTLYENMQALSTGIETRSTAYEAAAVQLRADIESFNQRANSGSFTSQRQFNSERAALVARTNALDADRKAINDDIVTYNVYYNEYQEISKQIEGLNNSIDSFKKIEAAPAV